MFNVFKKIFPFVLITILWVVITLQTKTSHYYPESYEIKGFEFVTQPDDITCGPSSALMVLRRYGYEVSLEEVERHARTKWFVHKGEPFGMSIPEYMVTGMRKIGMSVSLRRGDLGLLKHFVSNNKPCIVLVRSSHTTWHYVVVSGYNSKSIQIIDPSCGCEYFISEVDFLGCWSFEKDMEGKEVIGSCLICARTGKWFDTKLIGPLGNCEFCGGTGRKPDIMCGLVKAADVYPFTIIVPNDPLD